jgi:hypothetical protein
MSISLVTAIVRHERRLRLVFTNSLAAAAFTTLSYYTVTSVDGAAASPAVVAVYSVTNSPNVVELHLGADLVQGALYVASAVGVPATDISTTPNPSEAHFRPGVERTEADLGTPAQVSDLERQLYGEDLVHDGRDFVETADGDLASSSGAPVVKADLRRALEASGLPWDPGYGLHGREYVDGPAVHLGRVPARAVEVMLRDDRVESATADVVLESPERTFVKVRPVLVGDKLLAGIGDVQAKLQ